MSDAASYPKVAQLKDVAAFRARLAKLGLALPIDERILSAAEGSPLAQPMTIGGFEVGNRWCIHPMEGWDANRDGSPSPHTLRRWQNFGRSGAKLIWGGEAAAVRPDGRANPNQTLATESNRRGLTALLVRIDRRPPRGVRLARWPARRPAAHALRPVLQAGRSSQDGAADRLPSSAAGRQVQDRPARRFDRVDRRRARPADRRLRGGRPPGRTKSASSSST